MSFLWLPRSRRLVVHSRINDYDLLVFANEDVGRSIHYGDRYEFSETRFIESFLSDDSTCIDVGANVGYFSVLMAMRSRQGRIYAFEPIPLNAALLRASVCLNRLDNVEVIECALGADIGAVAFTQSEDSAYSSIRDTERKPVERLITVEVLTLDAFIRNREISGIDVLKIDVEGAEGLVLEGARGILSDPDTRPKLIFMELYDPNLSAFSTTGATLVESLRTYGYTPFFLDNKSERLPYLEAKLESHYNVFFTPEQG